MATVETCQTVIAAYSTSCPPQRALRKVQLESYIHEFEGVSDAKTERIRYHSSIHFIFCCDEMAFMIHSNLPCVFHKFDCPM